MGNTKSVILSPKQTKLLVFGYMRLNFGVDRCPVDIILLCVKWHSREMDVWNKRYIPKGVAVNNQNFAECKVMDATRHLTIVGSVTIHQFTMQQTWKLKCVNYASDQRSFELIVGIVPTNINTLERTEALYSYGYGYDAYDGRMIAFDKKITRMNPAKEGDILTFKYIKVFGIKKGEEDHGEIHFAINDDKLKKVFEVKLGKYDEYRFGVSFYCAEEVVQLLVDTE